MARRRPITEVDTPEILAVLKRIDSRGARYTAHRVRSEISRVFRYGIKAKDTFEKLLQKSLGIAQLMLNTWLFRGHQIYLSSGRRK
ncbi:putative integrase [Burkholderia paludis]|uniref:Putative integrase n=1 Tax=Burkholderia paludis TaxID=1506587 RepID=A0A6J5E977_9BURK|nr:hypothetical protein LMG30113_04185 [Burkholderia paludis]VWC02622.1 putative integrase [Burkholderia paludis]